MTTRTAWTWSPEHGDYYCWHFNPATQVYETLEWGRNVVANPSPAQPARADNTRAIENATHYPAHQEPRPQSTQSNYSHGAHTRARMDSSQYQSPTAYDAQYQPGQYTMAQSNGFRGRATQDENDEESDEEIVGYTMNGYFNTQAYDFDYETIRDPRRYFKKGRVFMIRWSEPQAGQQHPFIKVRRFVVIRLKNNCCWCLPIHTYSGRATAKPGIKPEDHAPLVRENEQVQLAKDEKPLAKQPLVLLVENDKVRFDPLSRLDFGKIYTIHFNYRVRKIGRIDPRSMDRLEDYFKQCAGFGQPEDDPVEG